MSGVLYLCATPIGNLSDISERLKTTLENVDVVASEDTRRTVKLLNHLGIKKRQISYFEHNRLERGRQIINLLKEGKNVALVSDAGTPLISDPGEELVMQCAEEGIAVVPIPGPVAAVCALIASGLSTGRFAFEGFLSVNQKNRIARLEEIKNEKRTLIFYESPHKLRATLSDMYEVFGDRKIALCRELTKVHEEIIRTTLSAAQTLYSDDSKPKGEFVLVLAPAEDVKEKSVFENMNITEHFEYYIKLGMDEKTAMKKVAAERGISKREVYQEIKIGD